MAHRIELYAAVAFLFLLLPVNQSATIRPAHVNTQNKTLAKAKDALNHLKDTAADALRPETGTHTVGCIKEAGEQDRLNCSIIHTFSSYLNETLKLEVLEDDIELCNKLKDVTQRVEDLKNGMCGIHAVDICEKAFKDNTMTSENLEKLRSILMLLIKWFSKPMA